MSSKKKLCASYKLMGHSCKSSVLCSLYKKRNTLYIPQKRTNENISIEEEFPAESSRSASPKVRIDPAEEQQIIVDTVVDPTIILAEEPTKKDTDLSIHRSKFNMSCGKGKYVLPFLELIPPGISELLNYRTSNGKYFLNKIRGYNSTLSFILLGAKIDNSVANNQGGVYCFRIHGIICHRIGSICPSRAQDIDHPQLAQVYIYEAASQAQHHCHHAPYLKADILEKIQSILIETNPFVSLFRSMDQVLQENGHVEDVAICLVTEGPQD
ncbi:hypothetical protein PHYBLDRAFT_162158 [Phycomyces blakesleeanus NRRL 1555(-)]|uniref:Helitron helicase-like domain-containing protein n=1 Tax=Phycomyces blakesleeanus (strain ATCC 8743b / DSM 1359 / FGSC 10004 / NBRC 33097 / NRRL 1555) TaxID=763407 RepID=A0A163EU09_PHYB8|nr:hypothetical protein PHYBLDRAFT_162158 [Phycomyces blakesleeanus NRRL 1555(-)]OAD81560.1 hypothetical protein PHYBLDRAFT_162158 [Phycomyces blakesleeanus NRRL 1555(-)]|eukprot:XP_018299600.1 hypothetical protein PHYBLDRAFT_162158 [Phycomyces blakesleeanus NRRL 1555(-)]